MSNTADDVNVVLVCVVVNVVLVHAGGSQSERRSA